MSHVPNLFSAMPGHTPYACPACVYGEGAHSDWCPCASGPGVEEPPKDPNSL